MKDGNLEESILDFFIVCSSVLPFVTQMVIDESKKHILTNYKQVRNNGKATDSDHFTQYMDVNLEFKNEKPVRQEIFNFKDTKSQEIFKNLTSETTAFTECFEGEVPLLQKVEKWRKVLQSYCKKSFSKIRIKKPKTDKISKPLSVLIDKRNKLLKQKGSSFENDRISKLIADIEAQENRNKIMKSFHYFSEHPENIQMQKMWKALKAICPKLKPTLPSAKKNHRGKIISGQKDIKNLLAKEYKNRLRTRPVRQDYKSVQIRKNQIFRTKMKLSKAQRSKAWTIKDLECALSALKNNESRDFEGYVNEIFKTDIIGSNLKMSLLIMFNSLKKENLIPSFMNFANVTTVPKSGSRLEPENERGIFRTEVVRAILMRLIYNTKYTIIDSNMSDCQMGARKGKGCRSNIWIINGIIHEALKSIK